jgi:hypothetical protein
MQDFSTLHRPDIGWRQGHKRDRLTFRRHKLKFERFPILVGMDNRAHVTGHKRMFRNIAGENDGI